MYAINKYTLEVIECEVLNDDFVEITEEEFNKFINDGVIPEISNNGVKNFSYKGFDKDNGEQTFSIDAKTGVGVFKTLVANNAMIAPTVTEEDDSNNVATTNWVNSKKYQPSLGFTPVQQGGGADQLSNKVFIGWSLQGKLKLQVDSTDLGNVALESWVNEQKYLNQSSLNGYATEGWVNNQGYLTQSSLNGYATEIWVNNQGYLKQDSLRGYATEQWVNEQGYLKQGSLNDYATKNYVDTLTGGSYISRTTSGNFTGSGHGNITFTISLTVISQIINKDVISFVKIEFMPLQNTSGGNETITMGIVNLFNALKFTFTSNIDGSTPVHTTSSTCVPDLVRCTVNAIDKIFRISGNGGGNGWSIGGNVSNTFISNTIGRFTA
jgi:hypothetical protein